jgi:hypothetical protein
MTYREFIKLGINHHLLFADYCAEPRGHYETLMPLIGDPRFEVLDIWVPEQQEWRRKEIDALLSGSKEIYYNVGTRKGKESPHPATLDPRKRQYSLEFYKSELDRALEAKAKKVITNSGADVPENRAGASAALVDFYCEICEYVGPEVLILVEPTDRDVSKRKLIGPSSEAVTLTQEIHQAGYINFASMIDMGHLPLLHETIDQAMSASKGYIGHIHLGNCILKDQSHPLFGDKHVPWGIEGGEYDYGELAELISIGLMMTYFSRDKRGSASFEMRPYPDTSAQQSLNIFFEKLEKAWDLVVQWHEVKGGIHA